MKNFKTYLAYLTVVCMLFVSCSKEDDSALAEDPANKGSLSFGAYLNDLVANKAALKQAVTTIPDCSDDAPAYVEVVLSQGGSPVVGTMANPLRVTVNPTPQDYDGDGEAEYFTNESTSLELDPGTYTLEYFTVRNSAEDVIWVAPIDDGESIFATFVDTALPMDITVGAGVKKYVDVEVLCFDDREVNEYGYLFFDIETNEAFEFCFFANYCPPSGRHFPAAISVDIWVGTDNTGVQIYSDEINVVGTNEDNDLYARPVCLALPDLAEYADDEDYFYYEVTVLDWDGAYNDVEQAVINGTLSRNDIEANFDGENNVDYLHLRFNCEDDGNQNEDCPGDEDCDEVPDNDDACPGFDDRLDADQDTIPDGCDVCPGHDDREDEDNDGTPDGCDTTDECTNDDDCDGVPNEDDQCPGADDNMDADNDNIPDECDECPNDATNECNNDDEWEVVDGCETAIMEGDTSFFAMDFNNNRWGWAEQISADGTYTHDLWAAAGQNNTANGYLAGEVTLVVDGDDVQVTIDLHEDNSLREVHIYLDGQVPATNAPGQFTYKYDNASGNSVTYNLSVEDFDSDGFWAIVHTVVCGDEEAEDDDDDDDDEEEDD